MGTHCTCKAPVFTSDSSTHSSNKGFKGKRVISPTEGGLYSTKT